MTPRTDHFDGKFFNPNGAKVPPLRMMPRMLRARWTRWPASIPVSPRQPPSSPGPGDVAVTFIGHATFRHRILFPGDTGFGPHFRDIAERLGSIDLALLPIGAYEPRWFMKDIHMNPAEAVQAHLDLVAQSLGMHFGTFQLTPEGVDEPARDLAVALRERGVPAERFRAAEVGETVWLCGGA